MTNTVFYVFRVGTELDSRVIDSNFVPKLPEPHFDPYLLENQESGVFKVKVEEDFFDCVCNFSAISSSGFCKHYIFHLFAYLKDEKMQFEEFFGFTPQEYQGELFQYYLLLVEQYLQLRAAEKAAEDEEDEGLMSISDDNDEEFSGKKDEAKVLLNMLALTSHEFRENPYILPILHRVIDLFIKQFPDAFFLAILANFTESGFDSVSLVSIIYEGMQSGGNELSFRDERIFQTLGSFKNFPGLSYFTPPKMSSILTLLLTSYCGEYSAEELRTAILNVTAFVMQKFPDGEAMQALNQIFTGLGKTQKECARLLLEAIIQNEMQRIRLVLSDPNLPLNVQQIGTILKQSLLPEIFRDQYKALVTLFLKDSDKVFLKQTLRDLTESSSLARLVFGSLFNSGMLPRIVSKNLESLLASVFDAEVNATISDAHDAEEAYKRFKRGCDSQIISTNQEETILKDMNQMLESLHVLCLRMSQNPTLKDVLAQIKGEATSTEFERTEKALSKYPQTKLLKELRAENAAALAELQKKNCENYCKLRVGHDKCKELRNKATRLILERILNCSS